MASKKPSQIALMSPLHGVISQYCGEIGDHFQAGETVVMIEAMKMQHTVKAAQSGVLTSVAEAVGTVVQDGDVLGYMSPTDHQAGRHAQAKTDLKAERADLSEVQARHDLTKDSARPDAVAKRHQRGQRTARENIEDLCDPESFVEFGGLAIAAQRTRRDVDDLIRNTPADGIVTGFGRINRADFPDANLCAVLHYDYTVLAGTQGVKGHEKTDRIVHISHETRRPLILFAEGGGGRPGDVDILFAAGLHVSSFSLLARLSGLVPLIGIVSGNCFAGNAAFLGCCDVIIATENSSIGMGGPAMIAGGGLGTVAAKDIGPSEVQSRNGVIDILVADETEAVRVAKHYLSFFQGDFAEGVGFDPQALRNVLPEDRTHIYDVKTVIEGICDTGSVLELRAEFGQGMVTALARIDGKALGIIANNPTHLAGAIDVDGADKAARFMQLCDSFDIPLLFLCDTPGIMVGPESEARAHVRHCTRLFLNGANLSIPTATIILRKAYGLGAMAMAGGGFRENLGTVAWPSGEFGFMGLEGAVELGFRKELEAIKDPDARAARYDEMVAELYAKGKALNAASFFEIDDVIDPANTRDWVSKVLLSTARPFKRDKKKRPNIDSW